jgi:Zn-dependent protease
MSRPDPKPSLQGSFRLFRVFGISVYLHWSWFLLAYYEFQSRSRSYGSQVWNVAEYLAVFGLVLLHEFGHALACRQVGGQADQIVLWPLGGIAYVAPPPRPGAVLWSIAAGPLVNLVLVPVTLGAWLGAGMAGEALSPNISHFLETIVKINFVLLIFNMLPIYPLDGGQIVQALLWFVMGRAKSLSVVSIIGIVAGIAALAVSLLLLPNIWMVVIAAFVIIRSITGFQQAQLLARLENAPRHEDAVCPSCKTSPVMGKFWVCDQCHTRFDTFQYVGMCPRCGKHFVETSCPSCGATNPLATWFPPVEAAPASGTET